MRLIFCGRIGDHPTNLLGALQLKKLFVSFNHYQCAIGLTIFAGILLRIGHLFFISYDEPFRLGGLFLEFSNQIIKNNFLLPVDIPYYSENGLPFAYPPLPFYIQAIFLSLFKLPQFYIVNILPPVVAALTIPSFYYLLKQTNANRMVVWTALAAFVFIPNTFLNQIEAAGLAESFGELFLIWYVTFLLKVDQQPTRLRVILAGVFLGFNVLSSPGSAVGAPIISLFFGAHWLLQAIKQHKFKPLLFPIAIGLIGMVVSISYWGTVMAYHGKGIFLVSLLGQFQAGKPSENFIHQGIARFLSSDYSGGSNLFLWNSLIFFGLIICLTGPGFYLSLLFILFAFLPREGVWIGAILASLLAGKGLELLFQNVRKNLRNYLPQHYKTAEILLMVVFLGAALFNAIDAIVSSVHDRQMALPAQQVVELENHNQVIPQDAKVIIRGNDGLLEWAPQLLKREVINTVYGLEWQPCELEKVNYFNRDLDSAHTVDDLVSDVNQYYDLQKVYLVTNDKAQLSKLMQASSSSDRIDMLFDGKTINILRISLN